MPLRGMCGGHPLAGKGYVIEKVTGRLHHSAAWGVDYAVEGHAE